MVDYVAPPSGQGKVFDFHNSGSGPWQANFHVDSPFGQASSVIHDRVIRGRTPLSVSDLPLEGVLDIVDGVLTDLL